jgi:hypothetical protein
MNCKQLLLFGLMCGILSLTACGGGGGGGGGGAAPQTATLKLSTSGTLLQGTSFAGIGVTVTLPAGVTVRTDPSGAVANGVVTVSGVAAPGIVISVYTPASGGSPATLALSMASTATTGFGTGEFVTVTCNRASGISPQFADFALTGFNPFDLNGNPVTGLTVGAIVELK